MSLVFARREGKLAAGNRFAKALLCKGEPGFFELSKARRVLLIILNRIPQIPRAHSRRIDRGSAGRPSRIGHDLPVAAKSPDRLFGEVYSELARVSPGKDALSLRETGQT